MIRSLPSDTQQRVCLHQQRPFGWGLALGHITKWHPPPAQRCRREQGDEPQAGNDGDDEETQREHLRRRETVAYSRHRQGTFIEYKARPGQESVYARKVRRYRAALEMRGDSELGDDAGAIAALLSPAMLRLQCPRAMIDEHLHSAIAAETPLDAFAPMDDMACDYAWRMRCGDDQARRNTPLARVRCLFTLRGMIAFYLELEGATAPYVSTTPLAPDPSDPRRRHAERLRHGASGALAVEYPETHPELWQSARLGYWQRYGGRGHSAEDALPSVDATEAYEAVFAYAATEAICLAQPVGFRDARAPQTTHWTAADSADTVCVDHLLRPFIDTYRFLEGAAYYRRVHGTGSSGTCFPRAFAWDPRRANKEFAIPLPAMFYADAGEARKYQSYEDFFDRGYSLAGTLFYRLYNLHRLLSAAKRIRDVYAAHNIQLLIDGHVPLYTRCVADGRWSDDALLRVPRTARVDPERAKALQSTLDPLHPFAPASLAVRARAILEAAPEYAIPDSGASKSTRAQQPAPATTQDRQYQYTPPITERVGCLNAKGPGAPTAGGGTKGRRASAPGHGSESAIDHVAFTYWPTCYDVASWEEAPDLTGIVGDDPMHHSPLVNNMRSGTAGSSSSFPSQASSGGGDMPAADSDKSDGGAAEQRPQQHSHSSSGSRRRQVGSGGGGSRDEYTQHMNVRRFWLLHVLPHRAGGTVRNALPWRCVELQPGLAYMAFAYLKISLLGNYPTVLERPSFATRVRLETHFSDVIGGSLPRMMQFMERWRPLADRAMMEAVRYAIWALPAVDESLRARTTFHIWSEAIDVSAAYMRKRIDRIPYANSLTDVAAIRAISNHWLSLCKTLELDRSQIITAAAERVHVSGGFLGMIREHMQRTQQSAVRDALVLVRGGHAREAAGARSGASTESASVDDDDDDDDGEREGEEDDDVGEDDETAVDGEDEETAAEDDIQDPLPRGAAAAASRTGQPARRGRDALRAFAKRQIYQMVAFSFPEEFDTALAHMFAWYQARNTQDSRMIETWPLLVMGVHPDVVGVFRNWSYFYNIWGKTNNSFIEPVEMLWRLYPRSWNALCYYVRIYMQYRQGIRYRLPADVERRQRTALRTMYRLGAQKSVSPASLLNIFYACPVHGAWRHPVAPCGFLSFQGVAQDRTGVRGLTRFIDPATRAAGYSLTGTKKELELDRAAHAATRRKARSSGVMNTEEPEDEGEGRGTGDPSSPVGFSRRVGLLLVMGIFGPMPVTYLQNAGRGIVNAGASQVSGTLLTGASTSTESSGLYTVGTVNTHYDLVQGVMRCCREGSRREQQLLARDTYEIVYVQYGDAEELTYRPGSRHWRSLQFDEERTRGAATGIAYKERAIPVVAMLPAADVPAAKELKKQLARLSLPRRLIETTIQHREFEERRRRLAAVLFSLLPKEIRRKCRGKGRRGVGGNDSEDDDVEEDGDDDDDGDDEEREEDEKERDRGGRRSGQSDASFQWKNVTVHRRRSLAATRVPGYQIPRNVARPLGRGAVFDSPIYTVPDEAEAIRREFDDYVKAAHAEDARGKLCNAPLEPIYLVGHIAFVSGKPYTVCGACGSPMLITPSSWVEPYGYVCQMHGLTSGGFEARTGTLLPAPWRVPSNSFTVGSIVAPGSYRMQRVIHVTDSRQLAGVPDIWLHKHGKRTLMEALGAFQPPRHSRPAPPSGADFRTRRALRAAAMRADKDAYVAPADRTIGYPLTRHALGLGWGAPSNSIPVQHRCVECPGRFYLNTWPTSLGRRYCARHYACLAGGTAPRGRGKSKRQPEVGADAGYSAGPRDDTGMRDVGR